MDKFKTSIFVSFFRPPSLSEFEVFHLFVQTIDSLLWYEEWELNSLVFES